jgi:hypothetical protein
MHIVEQSHPYWKGMNGFSKILFPTDFSKTANHALENAQKFMDMYVETEMANVPGQGRGAMNYRTVISEGRPAQQIVELAERTFRGC